MQKISPLRSSIEAFNKFKAKRAEKADKAQKTENSVQTNPFGIAFKGTVIQMDIFEKAEKAENKTITANIREKLQNASKLLSSARVATVNKFSSMKTNVIAFGNKLKDSTIATANKIREIGSMNVELNPFKYSVTNLQALSASELGTMLRNELQGVN